MKKHHVPAVALASITIGALIVDTAILATSGERTFITDDSKASTLGALFSGLVLGLTFAFMGWVVVRERPRFAEARRAARLARRPLTYGLFFLAGGFVTVYPLQTVAGLGESSPVIQVSGAIAFAALLSVVLSALVLGLALIGRNPLGIGGRVLGALLPVFAMTGLLAVVAPSLASPIFSTMVVLAGVSLLGVRAKHVRTPATRPASVSPTAA